MAQQLDRLEHARSKYDWPTWTNGRPWRAKAGRDFDCSVVGFRQTLYTHARKAGLRVSIAVRGDAVDFQFSGRGRK